MVSVAGFLTPHLLFFFGFPIRICQRVGNCKGKIKQKQFGRVKVL